MPQQMEGGGKGKQNMRLMWLIGAFVTLAVLWLIYSATQANIVSSSPSFAATASTTIPDSMPGMNH